MSLRVRRVETLEAFNALAGAWLDVTRASGQASPFLSHDWFRCCWRAVQPRRRPEVVIVEESGGPVAFLPLMHWEKRVRRLPVRALGCLAVPDTLLTDMVLVGDPARVIDAVLDHLAARGDWDVWHILKVPATSPALKTLEGLLPGRFPWRAAGTVLSPYVTISGTWEAFYRGKTQRFRKTCRNIENRVQRAGMVAVEEYRAVDPDAPLFAEVLEVSRKSWKGLRGLAMATMEGMPAFFRELTRRAGTNGWLHLWVFRLDGRAVATEYQLEADGRCHALRADFDPELGDLSPGACLNARIIQSLFERGGLYEYDMGPGTNEYKRRWASGAREFPTLEVYSPGTYGHLLHGIETRLVPLARRWRERFLPNPSSPGRRIPGAEEVHWTPPGGEGDDGPNRSEGPVALRQHTIPGPSMPTTERRRGHP